MRISPAQGEVTLVEHETAQRLLGSTELARLTFTAPDGVRMGRLELRPAWSGVIDFQVRLPGAMPS
jgi:hypothetical protein